MGVKDLWRLLAPCGHRISIDTLASQRLAVDVSIWLVQFLKAMRDDSGAIIPNAHLIGMLRRLCRLLYHGIRPVFVFDGPAPRLKKQTIMQRKKQRAQQGDAFERAAEKLVLGQLGMQLNLKARSMLQLRKKLAERAAADDNGAAAAAADVPQQRPAKKRRKSQAQAATASASKDEDAGADSAHAIDVDDDDLAGGFELEEAEHKSPARHRSAASFSASRAAPAVAASTSAAAVSSRRLAQHTTSMEDDDDDAPAAAAFKAPFDAEDDRDQDEREAFVLPADGVVDASVLAKLPISLQYTVLQQQREHNRFHNFHKFSAVEHDPLKFSEMQMAAFLKSVKFSQSIDTLRKEMNLSVVPSAMRGAEGADGSKLLVQGALRVPSNPAGGGYVYYKTDDPTQPFSWQAAIKNKKMADARAEKREQSKGKDGKRVNQREGMESVQEERDRLLAEEERELFAAQLAAQAAVSSAEDEDWLCEHCSGVNSNLKRLASSAQKNTCQTCGTKREGVKEEESMHPLQRGLMATGKPSAATALPSSLPAFAAATTTADQPRVPAGASTWISPADRYSDGKPPLPRARASAATSSAAAAFPPVVAFSIRPAPRPAPVASDELPALENAAARAAPLASTLHAALDARDAVSSCPHCTFINPLHARVCGMCEQPLSDDNVAMLTGPSSLAASFQAKAARRVAHLSAHTAAAVGTPAASSRSAPIDFTTSPEPTVTLTTHPPPAAAALAPASAVDLADVSGPIDLSLDAIESAGAPADGVDDLFADLLAAKSIAPMQLKSVASVTASASTAPVSSAASTPASSCPSQSILAAASAPLQPSFLEISDDESVDAETAAAIASVETAEAEAAAMESARLVSRAEARRKLEMQEAAQLRAATRASLKDPATTAAQRKPAGLSMHATASALAPAAVLNLADLTASAATAEVIDDDVLWEEDEVEMASAPSAPAATAAAVELAAAPSLPLPAVEEALPTAMDMSDSDDDAAPRAAVKSEPERASSTTIQPPVSHRGAAASWLSGPARIPPRPPSPAIELTVLAPPPMRTPADHAAAAASPPATPEREPAAVSASAASPPLTRSSEPVADEVMDGESPAAVAAAATAPPLPSSPSAIAASSSSPLDLSIPLDDYDDVDRPDDDAATLLQRKELRTLMAEFEADKLRLAQAQTAATRAPAEGAKEKEAASDESDEEDDDDQKSAYSIEQAAAAATTAGAAAVPSSSAVPLPFGLSLTAVSPASAQSAASAAFREHQRQKRAQEAAEEKARQEATDRKEAEVLGQAAPAAAASSADDPGAVWEAFPSTLDAADSIRLAASFDSSYLETNIAAREAAQARRGAEHVTEEMISDSKEILALFGIPFIVAPGEAEAQCAVLESLQLVEGVITDDSDVFLFGASTVHRHFFEAKKYAESYRMKEVTNKLGMDRRKLIHFALLLGSDYTEGVKGVGIVNATEILQAFPGERGLEELREWVYSTTEMDLEPSLPVYPDDASDEERTAIDTAYRVALFKFKHRNTKRSWAMSRSFPNREIIDAYLRPNVDDSGAEITWGVPQWDKIRDMMERKLGWSAEVVSQTIDPVIAQMSSVRQGVLDRFFHPDDSFAAIGSARLSRAVQGLVNNNLTEEEVQHQQQSTAKKAEQAEKRRVKAREKAALKRAEKAAAAEGPASAPAAASADRSLFDDDDFALSAEDEAMLAAAEAKASPQKAPAPAAAPKRSKSKAAASAAGSPPASAKPKATRKRKSLPSTPVAAAAAASSAASAAPEHQVIDLD